MSETQTFFFFFFFFNLFFFSPDTDIDKHYQASKDCVHRFLRGAVQAQRSQVPCPRLPAGSVARCRRAFLAPAETSVPQISGYFSSLPPSPLLKKKTKPTPTPSPPQQKIKLGTHYLICKYFPVRRRGVRSKAALLQRTGIYSGLFL